MKLGEPIDLQGVVSLHRRRSNSWYMHIIFLRFANVEQNKRVLSSEPRQLNNCNLSCHFTCPVHSIHRAERARVATVQWYLVRCTKLSSSYSCSRALQAYWCKLGLSILIHLPITIRRTCLGIHYAAAFTGSAVLPRCNSNIIVSDTPPRLS